MQTNCLHGGAYFARPLTDATVADYNSTFRGRYQLPRSNLENSPASIPQQLLKTLQLLKILQPLKTRNET